MASVEVDPEVFQSIQNARRAGETDNDVIRRVFGLSGSRPAVIGRDQNGVRARTVPELVRAGVLHPGDVLRWATRGREPVEGRIDAEGWLVVAGVGRFDKPSGPLTKIAGHEVNGWVQWRLVSSGETLHELRLHAQTRGA